MTVNEKLRKLRIDRGLSQYDIMRELGIHQNGISLLENGKRNPSYNTLAKYCEFIGIGMDYFAEDEKTEVSFRRESTKEKRVRILATIGRMSDGQIDCLAEIIDMLATSYRVAE